MAITKGVAELPVLDALFGSINVTVVASIVPSSVSFEVIAFIVTAVSSLVVFPESFTTTGASFTDVTSTSNVLVTSTEPSVNV